MCIIIERYPGHEVPFEQLKNACLRNPHGFGISYCDGNNLEVLHHFAEGGNDPEIVARRLEELQDVTTICHLRYATAGKPTLDNCHPIRLTTDGTDIDFFHNGTLHKFTDKESLETDSYRFSKQIVEPLIRRFREVVPVERLLDDPLLINVLDEYAGDSTFTLIDSFGSILWINDKQRGKEFEWGKVSNKYALEKLSEYNKKDTKTYYIGHYSNNNKKENPLKDKKQDTINNDLFMENYRFQFKDISGGFDIEDMMYLDTEDIVELCQEHPKSAALLILDCLAEIHAYQEDDNVAA